MISINIDGLQRSLATVRQKGLEAQAKAMVQYRARVMAIYVELLRITPQWSSDFVGNWDIEVEGFNSKSYLRSMEKAYEANRLAAPHHAGEEDSAFVSAKMRGLRRLQDLKFMRQHVYFVNSTPLEIDSPKIVGIDGAQMLRDEGVAQAWLSITSYLQARYGVAK